MNTPGYLSIWILTRPVLAANARGESPSNRQTLQLVSTAQGVRTVISGYALRYAIRAAMEDAGASMWRSRRQSESASGYGYGPANEPAMVDALPDDRYDFDDTALFGYMCAPKAKEATVKVRSAVTVSAALSTTSFGGDYAFVQGLKQDGTLNPFSHERHLTRYTFTVGVNLGDLAGRKDALAHMLAALPSLQVGGNHAANASTVHPEVVCWRFHQVPGQGGMYVPQFTHHVEGEVSIEALERQANDLGFEFESGGHAVRADRGVRDALKLIAEQARERMSA